MKNIQGLKGFIVFLLFLWAIVVTHYAGAVGNRADAARLMPLQSTSCSSSSSSSSSSSGPVE